MMPTPSKAIGQFYNPGYEHLTSIYRLKEAQTKSPLQAGSMYILPLLAMQNACLAIEEYVSLTGRKVDPAWEQTDWKDTPIQERIASLFKKMGQPLHLGSGIWQEVILLFETLRPIKGDLLEMKTLQSDEIPEKVKQIAVEYPIYRSQAIAEEAVDILLDQLDFSHPLKKDHALAEQPPSITTNPIPLVDTK